MSNMHTHLNNLLIHVTYTVVCTCTCEVSQLCVFRFWKQIADRSVVTIDEQSQAVQEFYLVGQQFTCLQYYSFPSFFFPSLLPFPSLSSLLFPSPLSHCPPCISLSLFLISPFLISPTSNLSSLVHSCKVGDTSTVQEHE